MNHYHADAFAYYLEKVFDHSTTIAAPVGAEHAIDPTHIKLTDGSGFLLGDSITITTDSGDYTTTLVSLAGSLAVISPAVADVEVGSTVRFALPFPVYTHNTLSDQGDVETLQRPCAVVTLPHQPRVPGLPKGPVPEVVVFDRTLLAVYIETPFTITVAGTKRGGFTAAHLPAIRHVRDFIWTHTGIEIPSALEAVLHEGTLQLCPDDPPEQTIRTADCERHVFFVLVSEITTIYGGN